MSFSEKGQSIRDDAVIALADYMEGVKKAKSLNNLYDCIESLLEECTNWMDEIDSQIANEEE